MVTWPLLSVKARPVAGPGPLRRRRGFRLRPGSRDSDWRGDCRLAMDTGRPGDADSDTATI